MKTILILVGKTQNKHFVAGIKDYTERIGHYMPFEIRTIPELKNTKSLSEAQQKEKEGQLILQELQSSDTVVLLDEHGKEFRSIELADWLQHKQNTVGICHRWSVWLLTGDIRPRQRQDLALAVDFQSSDGKTHLCRTALSRLYDH